jgi:hypothetical protein
MTTRNLAAATGIVKHRMDTAAHGILPGEARSMRLVARAEFALRRRV